MIYVCKRECGEHLAVIEDEAGNRLDAEVCPSKYASMLRRDEAQNAGVLAFADLGERPLGHHQALLPALTAIEHPAGEPVDDNAEPSEESIEEIEIETEDPIEDADDAPPEPALLPAA